MEEAIRLKFKEATQPIQTFVEKLKKEGVQKGVIGPKEVDKLFERHILNCAVVADEIRQSNPNATIVDVGSGGGFPGIVIACTLPNTKIFLVEAMERRVKWLEECIAEIGLNNTTVVRGRAENVSRETIVPKADFVTARAVAPLNKLLPWTMPFLKKGGSLVALKGERVTEEIADAKKEISRFSNAEPKIVSRETLEGFSSATLFILRRDK